MTTLDAFIAEASKGGSRLVRAFVTEPGFKQLYVRYAARYWRQLGPDEGPMTRGIELSDVLILANAEAAEPGSGAMTRLLARLRRDHPRFTILAELPHARLAAFLHRQGFITLRDGPGAGLLMRPPSEQP